MVSHSSSEVSMRFKTAKEYVDYRIKLQEQYRYEYTIPKEELYPIIDALRELPRDEASDLLSIYGYVRDGDYGYGCWETGYEYWDDFSD
jgi:hypothetical protein